MKTLAVFDRMDYDISLPRYIRNAVRAIIIADNRIAMLYSKKYEFYSFPGGGIESGEANMDALIRETREETGLIIVPQSVKAYGMTTEIRKDLFIDGIYEHREFYYNCDAEDTVLEQRLTQAEEESEYQLAYVSLDEAILLNELGHHIERKYTEPETYILKLLRDRE